MAMQFAHRKVHAVDLDHVQTNRSKAGINRSKLAQCFMLVLFLLVLPDN